MKEFDSDDAQERPWAYDHTTAMGAGIGFIFHLFVAVIVGTVLQVVI